MEKRAAIGQRTTRRYVGASPPSSAVATPINIATEEDPVKLKKLREAIPAGRMAKPREIAEVVAFLADDAPSYMTATTVIVDGGMMQASPGL